MKYLLRRASKVVGIIEGIHPLAKAVAQLMFVECLTEENIAIHELAPVDRELVFGLAAKVTVVTCSNCHTDVKLSETRTRCVGCGDNWLCGNCGDRCPMCVDLERKREALSDDDKLLYRHMGHQITVIMIDRDDHMDVNLYCGTCGEIVYLPAEPPQALLDQITEVYGQ